MYEVRRRMRRQNALLQKKLAYSKKNSSFWSDVRLLNRCSSPVVDGVVGGGNIANVFASKLEGIFNTNSLFPLVYSVFHSIFRDSLRYK